MYSSRNGGPCAIAIYKVLVQASLDHLNYVLLNVYKLFLLLCYIVCIYADDRKQ